MPLSAFASSLLRQVNSDRGIRPRERLIPAIGGPVNFRGGGQQRQRRRKGAARIDISRPRTVGAMTRRQRAHLRRFGGTTAARRAAATEKEAAEWGRHHLAPGAAGREHSRSAGKPASRLVKADCVCE